MDHLMSLCIFRSIEARLALQSLQLYSRVPCLLWRVSHIFPRTPRLFAETIPGPARTRRAPNDEGGTIAFPKQYPKPISLLPRVPPPFRGSQAIAPLCEGYLRQKNALHQMSEESLNVIELLGRMSVEYILVSTFNLTFEWRRQIRPFAVACDFSRITFGISIAVAVEKKPRYREGLWRLK